MEVSKGACRSLVEAAASLKPQRHGIYQGSQSAGREQGPLPGRDGWRLAFNAFPANVSYHSFLNNYLPERGGRRQNVQMHQRGNDSSSSSEGGGNPQWNLRRYQTTLPHLATAILSPIFRGALYYKEYRAYKEPIKSCKEL